MSSVVVSSPYTSAGGSSGGGGGRRRKSLFKPSTWTLLSNKHKHEIHDGLAPAGIAEGGAAGGGRSDRDFVETGAPLTGLVHAEEAAHPHSHPSAQPHPEHQQQRQQERNKAGEEAGEVSNRDAAATTTAAAAGATAGSGAAVLENQATLPSPLSASSGLTTQVDSLGRVVFFRQDLPNYHLSNSCPAYPIHYNSIRYPTAEHLFQALKFLPNHPDLASKVRRAKHPLDAIRIARSNTASVHRGWISEGLNVRIMHQVVLAKFSQYSQLTHALLETEDREIINDTPSDVFWGIGEGRGRNVLGKILMDVRELLRAVNGLGWGSAAKTM